MTLKSGSDAASMGKNDMMSRKMNHEYTLWEANRRGMQGYIISHLVAIFRRSGSDHGLIWRDETIARLGSTPSCMVAM